MIGSNDLGDKIFKNFKCKRQPLTFKSENLFQYLHTETKNILYLEIRALNPRHLGLPLNLHRRFRRVMNITPPSCSIFLLAVHCCYLLNCSSG